LTTWNSFCAMHCKCTAWLAFGSAARCAVGIVGSNYPILSIHRRTAAQGGITLWAKSSQFACATARSFGSAAALRKPEATSFLRGQTRPGASRKRMATGVTYVPAAAASSSLSSLSACHGMLCRPKRLAGTR
jgi:hypothetical protein